MTRMRTLIITLALLQAVGIGAHAGPAPGFLRRAAPAAASDVEGRWDRCAKLRPKWKCNRKASAGCHWRKGACVYDECATGTTRAGCEGATNLEGLGCTWRPRNERCVGSLEAPDHWDHCGNAGATKRSCTAEEANGCHWRRDTCVYDVCLARGNSKQACPRVNELFPGLACRWNAKNRRCVGPVAQPTPDTKFRSRAVGEDHLCYIRGGDLYCWGGSRWGQTGYGNTGQAEHGDAETIKTALDCLPAVDVGGNVERVYAHDDQTCVIIDGIPGDVKCWGRNLDGRLGQGTNGHTSDEIYSIGDEAGEMGTALPVVDLPGKALALALGDRHTCAVLDNPEYPVVCWGYNANGELGYKDESNEGPRTIGDQSGEMGNNLTPVPLALAPGKYIVDISAGEATTCVVTNDGDVGCWGSNEDGALGNGDGDGTAATGVVTWVDLPTAGAGAGASQISCAEEYCCVVLEDSGDSGDVYCWGDGDDMNHPGETDNIPASDMTPAITYDHARLAVKQVVAGYDSACALFDVVGEAPKTETYCWGNGNEGETGRGDEINTFLGSDVAADLKEVTFAQRGPAGAPRYATSLDATDEVFCATVSASGEQDRMVCWGDCSYGQCGHGGGGGDGGGGDIGDEASETPLEIVLPFSNDFVCDR